MKIIRDFLEHRLPVEDWRHITDEVEIRALLKERLEEALDELADQEYLSIDRYAEVMGVLHALMHWHHIDRHVVHDACLAKNAKDGAFYTGLVYEPVNKDRGN